MPVTASALAQRYGCSVRTIWRLKSRGLDVENVMDVGLFIIGNPHSTKRMTESVLALLQTPTPEGGFESGWRKAHLQDQ